MSNGKQFKKSGKLKRAEAELDKKFDKVYLEGSVCGIQLVLNRFEELMEENPEITPKEMVEFTRETLIEAKGA